MNDEGALLAAIAAAPDDDAPRLVYADWLEERGDPRAEYVRLEVEGRRVDHRLNDLREQFDRTWIRAVDPPALKYDVAYHMRCELTLRTGRTITLESLDQQMTYAGLIEGRPNKRWNDSVVSGAVAAAARNCGSGTEPYLIPPQRRDYLREPGDMQHVRATSPGSLLEWLPMVRCIGSFKDVMKARDPSKDLSVLTVVWFQDEYAPPILEPALGQLLSIDWENLATDVEF